MLLGDTNATGFSPEVFLVTTAPALLPEAFRRKIELSAAGVRADMDYEGRSVKSQFRRADRSGARVVLVFGEDEARRGSVVFREMTTGLQEEISVEEAIRRLHEREKEE
jgi:histidyl-tRNA synthetase